jgi:PAS domain S-box-containing protein
MRQGAQSPAVAEAESLLQQLANVFYPAGTSSQPPVRPDLEARYRTLVEQIPAIIFMALLDGGIGEAYVSPHLERMLGFTQAEWLDDPVRWYRQIHPDDRGRWSVEAAELFLTGNPLRSVYRVVARDGRVIWFDCQAEMVRSDDGRPWFIHGVAFDITDLKRAEEELKKAHDELEVRVQQRTAELERVNAQLAQRAEELARSNADLEQFAYSASHDLQEPIRNVAIYTEFLKQRYQGKLDASADQFLSFLTEGARRMEMLVRDLLAYTRTASDTEEPQGLIDANVVLAESLESLRVAIRESQAAITHDPLPAIRIQQVHLQQLLQNLLSNAIKYRSDDPPRIHISAKRLDGYWLFSVSDNGIGIPPEYQQKVFGIFKRLHGREKYPGTGIGLAICKKIVERFGGRIWVESEAGQGATFQFTLPARDNDEK